MYFEIAVRYIDFWKVKPGAIQPMFEAILDTRGIRNEDEGVRRRSFYLLSRIIRECKIEIDKAMIPIILDSLREMLQIHPKLPQADTPDDDPLLKATTGKNYFQDQLHLFEASGTLVYLTKSDPQSQMSFLAAIAGPLMAGVGAGLEQYKSSPQDQMAVLHVHHHLMALGHFAKGFPAVSDDQLEAQPYRQPFRQMTEALLEALEVMKTQRVVRDSARFAFSQFVTAIGSSVAELVPRFVNSVVTEFEPAELVDFLLFLSLLMHRLKKNTFETMDMLLLPLLSTVLELLKKEITGTDEAIIHRRVQEAYLGFFTALMNANLEGVFISERNKPQFENVLQSLVSMSEDISDVGSQRLAFAFFGKSVIAWATSATAVSQPSVFAESAKSMHSIKVAAGVAAPSNQHTISKEERATMALPGYETFIYQTLVPTIFNVAADPKFNVKQSLQVLYEMAAVLRNVVTARGQEGIDFLLGDMLPKIGCPPDMAQQLIERLRTQPARDFRKTYADFIKAMRS
jgi:exportin-T